jgi:dihydrofolate reductase
MQKLISFMHISLDGFCAGPNGEMDWIKVDDEIFDHVGKRIQEINTALYGRVTYQMMESYWPTAADKPGASKHDIQHSKWYMKAKKFVLSKSLAGKNSGNAKIISENSTAEINDLKKEAETNIVMFGSPTAAHFLMQHNLIDEYWITVNPVLIGNGVPFFQNIRHKLNLKLITEKTFASGVVGLHYVVS